MCQLQRRNHAALGHCLPIAVFVGSISSHQPLQARIGTMRTKKKLVQVVPDSPFGALEPPKFRISVGFRFVWLGDVGFFFLTKSSASACRLVVDSSLPMRLSVLEGGAELTVSNGT